ncbi:Phage integrase family protein, partial [Haemophilus influenzae]
PAVNDWQKKWM